MVNYRKHTVRLLQNVEISVY